MGKDGKPSTAQILIVTGIITVCISTTLLVVSIAVQRWYEVDEDFLGYRLNIGLFESCIPDLEDYCLPHSSFGNPSFSLHLVFNKATDACFFTQFCTRLQLLKLFVMPLSDIESRLLFA